MSRRDVTASKIEVQLGHVRRLVEKALGRRLQRRLYCLPEAARLLGVGKAKLLNLIAMRVVGTVKLGGREMIPAQEIQRVAGPSSVRRSRSRRGTQATKRRT